MEHVSNSTCSVLDMLDLDESIIDSKLVHLMSKRMLDNDDYGLIVHLLKYKHFINIKEDCDCENESEISLAAKVIKVITKDNENYVVDILKLSLCLNKEKLQQQAEHFLQQIWFEINEKETKLSRGVTSESDISGIILDLKLIDAVLDALLSSNVYVILFKSIPIESLLNIESDILYKHLLTYTFRKFMRIVKSNLLLDKIWQWVEDASEEFLKRVLFVLCSFSDFYLPLPNEHGVVSFESKVLTKSSYWSIISKSLDNTDPDLRKYGLFFLKRSLDVASNKRQDTDICLPLKTQPYIYWSSKSEANVMKEKFANYFILYESLEECQSNIANSAMLLFDSILTLNNNLVMAVVNLGFQHNNLAINEACLQIFLDNSIRLRNDKDSKVLLAVIDKISNFNSHSDHVDFLIKMFDNIFKQQHNTELILKNIKNISWSPISLFYLSFSLSKTSIITESIDLDWMKFLNSILNIPCNNVIIRTEVLFNCLKFILKNLRSIAFDSFLKMIQIIKAYDSHMIQRQSEIIIKYFKENFSEINLDNINLFDDDSFDIICLYCWAYNDSNIIAIKDTLIQVNFELKDKSVDNEVKCLKFVKLCQLWKKLKYKDCKLLADLSDSIKNNVEAMLIILLTKAVIDTKLIHSVSCVIIEFTENQPSLLLKEAMVKASTFEKPSQIYLHYLLLNKFFVPTTLSCIYNAITDVLNNKDVTNYDKNLILEQQFNLFNKNCFEEEISGKITELFIEIFNTAFTNSYPIILQIIPTYLNDLDMKELIEAAWNEIGGLKNSKIHAICMKHFIKVLCNQSFLSKHSEITKDYCRKVMDISNGNLSYLNQFLSVLPVDETKTIAEIMMHTYAPRRDQRIYNQTMKFIETLRIRDERKTFEIAGEFIDNETMKKKIIEKFQKMDVKNLGEMVEHFRKRIDEVFRNKQRYHAHSEAHRLLFRCLQNILYIYQLAGDVEFLKEDIFGWYLNLLAKLPHQPSVKLALEWIISLHIAYQDWILDKYLLEKLESIKIPQTSIFTILYFCIKFKIHTNTHTKDEFVYIVEYLLSQTMGQLFNTRLNAQYMALKLCKIIPEFSHKYDYTCNIIEKTFTDCKEEKALLCMQKNIFLNAFNIVENLTAKSIYEVLPGFTNVSLDEIVHFDSNYTENDIINIDKKSLKIKLEELVFVWNQKIENNSVNGNDMKIISNIQKKFIPWKDMLEQFGLNSDCNKSSKKSSLIVVASLIDKIPNLGGMARTSEIFGVEKLIIGNTKVIQDRQFQGLSVSADKWIDIEEVKPGDQLKCFIEAKRREGYTIVAAEQTSSSQPLNAFKFPYKTVLVMGHEKEGIPCDLLPYMDSCVEVPQSGVIRSLNVHVTAAIFVWEYVRQHF